MKVAKILTLLVFAGALSLVYAGVILDTGSGDSEGVGQGVTFASDTILTFTAPADATLYFRVIGDAEMDLQFFVRVETPKPLSWVTLISGLPLVAAGRWRPRLGEADSVKQ